MCAQAQRFLPGRNLAHYKCASPNACCGRPIRCRRGGSRGGSIFAPPLLVVGKLVSLALRPLAVSTIYLRNLSFSLPPQYNSQNNRLRRAFSGSLGNRSLIPFSTRSAGNPTTLCTLRTALGHTFIWIWPSAADPVWLVYDGFTRARDFRALVASAITSFVRACDASAIACSQIIRIAQLPPSVDPVNLVGTCQHTVPTNLHVAG